jgi:hypothetical protein
MTRFKLLATAAILSLMTATPALAQHMIEEPGMFAFTYPMGDLGIGSSRPPAGAMAMMRSDPRMKSHVMTTRHARPGK